MYMESLRPQLVPIRFGATLQNGSGDHNQPFRFGRRPPASAPYPFGNQQTARLLILRSRVRPDPRGDEGCWPPPAA